MVWLIGVGCLALGVVIGVVFARQFNADPARVRELEGQIFNLEERNNKYREDVSEHFNVTAELVRQMTESYKDVYQHLAIGAQELCSGEAALKLLPASSEPVFDTLIDDQSSFTPPKDYAAKQNPSQKGALAEDFGLDKAKIRNQEESPY